MAISSATANFQNRQLRENIRNLYYPASFAEMLTGIEQREAKGATGEADCIRELLPVSLHTWGDITAAGGCKGDLFVGLNAAGQAFDFALPQDWLNAISEFSLANNILGEHSYHIILTSTVWVYPVNRHNGEGAQPQPFSCCWEVAQLIGRFNREG